jgi:hypothetical protein
MPRFRSALNISLSELAAMLSSRRRELTRLHKQRRDLQRDLDRMDRAISRIEGSAGRGFRGGRARNSLSLGATIAQVLGKSSAPMAVGDVVQGVKKTGYRSGSANFRGLVNMTLVKDDRFRSVSRGMYQLEGKTGGTKSGRPSRKRKRSSTNENSATTKLPTPTAA